MNKNQKAIKLLNEQHDKSSMQKEEYLREFTRYAEKKQAVDLYTLNTMKELQENCAIADRSEADVQIHTYRIVTGIDVTASTTISPAYINKRFNKMVSNKDKQIIEQGIRTVKGGNTLICIKY